MLQEIRAETRLSAVVPPAEVAPTAPSCTHCGSEVTPPWRTGTAPFFCCAGCRGAFELLTAAGLGDYYAQRGRAGAEAEPVDAPEGDFAEFDAPRYRELYCRASGEGRSTTELQLAGVHCAACVWLLERLPRAVPGVDAARLDFARARLTVDWDDTRITLGGVAQALARLGYAPSAPRGRAAEEARRRELRGLLIRLGVAGAIAGNVMLMSLALYSGQWGSFAGGPMDATTRRFFEWASLIASLPSLAMGSLFFRGAWAAIRTRTAHMDLPIAIGILAAFGGGAYHTWVDGGASYFDTITTLIFLLLVGRYLQRRHQLAEADAAELIHSVMPAFTLLVAELGSGATRRVTAEEVRSGDVVEVASGDVVPVDGTVVRGSSRLDVSLLTGESVPCAVTLGDPAPAGAVNQGAPLWVRCEHPAAEARVTELLRAVERATSARTPLATSLDRIAGRFTLVVLGLSALTAATWWQRDPARAFDQALAVLIVACPCALAMATPLALSAAAAAAARLRFLFFDMRALEALARPAELLLDKTGTLTEGKPRLQPLFGEPTVWQLAAAAERGSTHPVARAICTYADGDPGATSPITPEIDETPGQGLRARFGETRLLVGSESFVLASAQLGDTARAALAAVPRGASPLLVALDGEVAAVGYVTDPVRSGVVEALVELRRAGHRLSLVSGDHPAVVRAVAEDLCRSSGDPALFDRVLGGVTPEQKLALVRAALAAPDRTARSPVVMVGDGVNDAAALAAADVGVAVRGASEACRLAADVYLGAAGATDLAALLAGSRRVLRTNHRGMAFSLVYNAVGIGLALAGQLSPLAAAILMPVSSLTVVTNAYRSRSFVRREVPA